MAYSCITGKVKKAQLERQVLQQNLQLQMGAPRAAVMWEKSYHLRHLQCYQTEQ